MALLELTLERVRNVIHSSVSLSVGINLFVGENASGKSSVLESIYFLGLGRSFRSKASAAIVNSGLDDCVIRGHALVGSHALESISFGVQLNQEGVVRLKIDGAECRSLVEFVRFFPAVFFSPSSVDELLSSSGERRAFLNFSLFHVEQSFQKLRLASEKSRAQINSIIKNIGNSSKFSAANGDYWLDQFCDSSLQIDKMRLSLVNDLSETFKFFLDLFELKEPVVLSYSNSAFSSDGCCYRDVTQQRRASTIERLVRKGHVDFGCHRGDLKLSCKGLDIADGLSRGQQRLVMLALKLSQLFHIRSGSQLDPMFLLDDLGAELDDKNQQRVLYILEQCGVQSFVTSISRPSNSDSLKEKKLFHVEHGVIVEES